MFKNKNMLPKIIGIAGCAGVGKDTVGKSIITYSAAILNKGYCRVAFADKVKEELEDFVVSNFGFSCVNGTREQKEIIRGLIVGYAESKRNQNPDYWIYQAKQKISNCLDNDIGVIVTDVRYKNEVEYIQKAGGQVIFLKRKGIEPPNEAERNSLPDVCGMANHKFSLYNINKKDVIFREVYNQTSAFIKKIFEE